MMRVDRIKFNSEGFKEILCSDGVGNLITQQTEDICARANSNNLRGGNGFATSIKIGSTAGRWIGLVSATDREARIAESEDKALSRAVF